MNNSFRALRYFRRDAPRIAVMALLLGASIITNLLKPWPLAIIVDAVLGTKPLPGWFGAGLNAWPKSRLLILLSVATLILHLSQGFLSAATNYLSIKVGLQGLRRVRNEVFGRMEKLSMKFYHGSKTGDLIYRATWDTYSFQTLFQQGLITFFTALLTLILMVVVMCQINVSLTLASLATAPLLVISVKYFGKKMRERGAEAQQADSQVTSFIQQTIHALPLIQSYTSEQDEERKFKSQTAEAQQKRLSQHAWELLYWLAIAVAFSIGTAAIVWLGSVQVINHKLTVGELLVFTAYLAQLYEPLNQLSHVGATVANASAGTQRVFEILDTKEEIIDSPNARAIAGSNSTTRSTSPDNSLQLTGSVQFDHVSFGYEKDQTVLSDINFALEAGQSLAIIGPSGVGKTTLLNLLPRFFDPIQGAVRLDGVDTRDLKLADLRSHIAVVPQEPILLPLTIAENIAYGKPGASLEEIRDAARAANADSFIQKLAQGYNTVVGEGAAPLSVGERQRLNLARAFLKDAQILLLDEPTSALDAESEASVIASVEQLMRKRTTLIVAHRLSTIQRVDKILVLQDGKVTQIGTPEALIAQQGYFADSSRAHR